MNQNPITGAFWVGSKRPDPWRLAFSLSVAIFASPVILDFRLRSWPGSLGDQKHRDAASKLRNGVRTCLYFWDLGDILMYSVMFIYIYIQILYLIYNYMCGLLCQGNVKGSFAVKVSSVHGERFQELHGTMRIERPWERAEGPRFPFFSLEMSWRYSYLFFGSCPWLVTVEEYFILLFESNRGFLLFKY